MKARAWILAAAIAAGAGSLTTPTAQACGITDDGSCISRVVWTQPSLGDGKNQSTKTATHPKRHKQHRSSGRQHEVK